MVSHIVFLRPRADISPAEREALLEVMRHAFENIPEIRRVHIGRRRIMGRAYDAMVTDHFEYAAVIEFDTEEALRTYLDHPAHAELGRRFYEFSEAALVHDFEMLPPERVGEWE